MQCGRAVVSYSQYMEQPDPNGRWTGLPIAGAVSDDGHGGQPYMGKIRQAVAKRVSVHAAMQVDRQGAGARTSKGVGGAHACGSEHAAPILARVQVLGPLRDHG